MSKNIGYGKQKENVTVGRVSMIRNVIKYQYILIGNQHVIDSTCL